MVKRELIEEFMPFARPQLVEVMSEISVIQHYRRGEHLYEIGDTQTKIYILLDGILRGYFIDEIQTEITDCFMTEQWMVANSSEVLLGGESTPSVIGVEVLADSKILEMPTDTILSLLQKYPELARFYVQSLHQALTFHNEINRKRLYLPGNERYEWFCEKWPKVEQAASNHQIATFLGIRSESLSRLRRQKRDNN